MLPKIEEKSDQEKRPAIRMPLPGPKAKALIERDQRVISPSYTRSYPLVVERAHGAMVEDPDGNRFLDFAAGIAVVATGHCHPRVVAAIQAQAAKLIHMSGTDFYYENMVALAEKLATLVPGGIAPGLADLVPSAAIEESPMEAPLVTTSLVGTPAVGAPAVGAAVAGGGPSPRRVYFGNSGTEAIEAAIKLARYHTGRGQFVAFVGAFHGRTMGSLALTASRSGQRKGFFPVMPGVQHVPYAYCYRCAYGKKPDTCAVECVQAIEQDLFRTTMPPSEVAAIFVEPIQGEGGYVIPPTKFFDALQVLAHKYGILIVADEVQCGMGRTGKMFASQHFGLEPDVIALAKGIASGMPLSAVVARADLMQWTPGSHASTFGGNPVAVAAALTTIELLEQELIDNAARVGAHLLARLGDLPQRSKIVGDVRGLGLMVGIELVRDQATKERAPDLRDRLVQMCFERGLLVLGAGPNTIRLCPPLVITMDQADFAAETIEECLRELVPPARVADTDGFK